MARRIIRVLGFFVGVQLAGCAANQPLETTERSCVMGPPDASVACTQEYDPVCGCDGKTYPNACVARAQGVPWSEPGPCEDDRLD